MVVVRLIYFLSRCAHFLGQEMWLNFVQKNCWNWAQRFVGGIYFPFIAVSVLLNAHTIDEGDHDVGLEWIRP